VSEQTTGWTFVAAQAVLLVALVLMPGRNDFDLPGVLRVATDVAFWAGVVLGTAAALSLGRALTATPVPNASGELRTGGVYRFARHPIYSGVILIVVSIAARSGSWWKVALGAATIAFFVAKTRWEEHRLRERFDEYDDYAATTGRFFPGW
jgi:protein-S-isoprenylcysteine O-methyltransferase Ste14